ncbi:glutaredoxin [Nitzschia inconspicua]|uniref:Glutaredoxin n=1 Tax=Nitzschia inconspicua TaxID=303405 RepID=A0A9K3PK35_9STRA|nr:glutathione peroxidase [Nitzschia inconspicua]KAG7374096.1 glutaredoxin [Nitzschia inconspicua]
MKTVQTFYTFLVLLATLFLVQRVESADASKASVQTLSTGETPSAFVRKKIDSHDVMVFARSYGPHNHQAKDLLKQLSKNLNVHVEFLDVDLLPGWDSSLIMMELQELTGQWSFPNIFIGKKHVGGNQELDQKHALGELEEMIKNAGQEL